MKIPDESILAKYLINTNFMVKVLAFNPINQTVDVISDIFEYMNQPGGEYRVNNEFGEIVTAGLKQPFVIKNIPVLQLRWGEFSIQAVPVPGDTGFITVFTQDIREWMKSGGISVPKTDSRFLMESCVFIPFVPNLVNRDQHYLGTEEQPANGLRLKSNGANVIIDQKSVKIGITSTEEGNGVFIAGNTSITGNLTATGNIHADGNITAGGNVEAQGDVKAGSISLTNHTHPVPASGLVAPTGGGPVTGSATSGASQ